MRVDLSNSPFLAAALEDVHRKHPEAERLEELMEAVIHALRHKGEKSPSSSVAGHLSGMFNVGRSSFRIVNGELVEGDYAKAVSILPIHVNHPFHKPPRNHLQERAHAF